MSKTSIQWTDHSINPIRFGQGHFCQKISPGCANCYASRLQSRFRNPEFKGVGGVIPHTRDQSGLWFDESKLAEVLRRKKPTRYFWCDMSDLFGAWVPDEWIDRCFATMALTPQHTHQVLTKRPERMRDYLTESLKDGGRWEQMLVNCNFPWPEDAEIDRIADAERFVCEQIHLPNVWLGVSVEDQQRADERIPLLLSTPAAVRFLSCEPLLGPLDLSAVPQEIVRVDGVETTRYAAYGPRIHWVIIGGESGGGARPMDLAWARSLVEQCQAAGVPVFCKQLGANVVVRNDDISEWFEKVTHLDIIPGTPRFQGEVERVRGFHDRKGGDIKEFPADLRVREFPR